MLSKTIAHALRHAPWLYELELNEEGWVAVAELLDALRQERSEWASLNEVGLAEVIERSDKKRYEIENGRIRALYGHSVPGCLFKQLAEPPPVLYHGTSPEVATAIRADGLRPMGRHYVHLSTDIPTAKQVGKRKTNFPVLLEIDAARAHAAGVVFYRGNDVVWLADHVPAIFVK